MLRQQAVFWPSPSQDGYGKNTFADPFEIRVRWDNSTESFTNAEGVEETSSAVIFSQDALELQGYLYLGAFEDLSAEQKADPHLVPAARQIRGYEETPTMKADFMVKKAFL